MELHQIFKLCLYGLTAFAAYILGRAEEGWIPYCTFPVLVFAFVVIETRPGRSLPAGPANLLGALSVAAAAWEFSQPNPEAKLLAGAHLLVYATWIVMLQEKTYRLYWWVMALGVLQVAVASVLQPGPWFGFSLILYLCASLATMSIAGMFQVQQQFESGDSTWKVLREERSERAPSVLIRPAVRYDESHRWLSRRFFGGLSVLIALSLLVSAGFFAFTPRIWFGPRNLLGDEGLSAPGMRRNSVTGFSREVRLGSMGEILESVEPVFTVRCRDARTGELMSLPEVADRLGMDEALFRGSVMTEYERGKWFPEQNSQPVKVGRVFRGSGFIQEFQLEPTSNETLFCVGSPDAVEIDGPKEDAFLELSTGILTRERRPESGQRLTYTVSGSPLAASLAQLRAVPTPQGLLWHSVDPVYLRRNAYIDQQRLRRVVDLSRERVSLLRKELKREPTPLEICHAFEDYLQDTNEFGYTLNLTVIDRSIDPVEDFLFNRKEGHCEYFASALTLMLRASGIPARMVTGYKGAELSRLRGTWVVQQRFAHAWVEAWSDNHQTWVSLDPTPSGPRAESVETVSLKLGFWGRLRATSTTVWQDYVVNVNLQQQKATFYAPVRDFIEKLLNVVRQMTSSWQNLWNQLVYVVTHPAEWLSVTGGIVTFVILTLGVAVTRGVLSLLAFLRRHGWSLWPDRSQSRIVVAFYERFLKAIRPLNLRRAPPQTPQEFAMQVGLRLREVATAQSLSELPLQISAAFYRVRFGGEELSAAELHHLESALHQLETALQPANR